MKILILLLSLHSYSVMAAINILPGLWKVDMTVKDSSGKKTDISKQMEEAMAKVSPEQKKQMVEMMQKMGKNVPTTQPNIICYSKEMLNNPSSISDQKESCKTDIISQSSTKMPTRFTCEDGTTGKADFKVKSQRAYTGHVIATNKEGEKSEINYVGSFISADCGDVKPIKI